LYKEPKKALIFGASGFIGGGLLRYLRENGICEPTGYSSADCDLLNEKEAANKLRFCDEETSIVLCSGITRTAEESYSALLKNISMVRNFISGLSDGHPRSVIFLSSADVYGMPPLESPVSEDTRLRPRGYYGLSKMIGEEFLRLELASRCPVTILRLPGVYGIGDKFQSIVGGFIKKVVYGEPVEIYGGGHAKRDFVEIEDVYKVIVRFMQKTFEGTVNIATGESVTINALVAAIAAGGIKPDVRMVRAKGIDGDLVFDTKKLNSICPDIRLMSVTEGIRKYMRHVVIRAGNEGEVKDG